MDNPVCPETGTPMKRDTRRMTLTYRGHSTELDMPGWYCPDCDEGIHSGTDMKVSDRALNRMKAQEEGLLFPEEIRRIRKKLNLTQEAAGQTIGGGPRAFQKYEAGELLPSRAISSALILLDLDPLSLKVLEAREQARTTSNVIKTSASKARKSSRADVNPKPGSSAKRSAKTPGRKTG